MNDVPAERSGFVTADGHRLEYRAWGDVAGGGPTLVFLHEGLGCAALWRDFPARASARTGLPALAYSRYGYGRSDVFTEPRTPRFMHDEATGALPELLQRLSITRPILVGHSDGGSIALIHASARPAGLTGVVALAPHLFVERETIASIADIAARFPASDLPRRMAKYHRDPDATFHGWADIWLDPAFRAWNIEAEVARVACPVLALQGREDEYGTMRQVERIAELCPQARWAALERCGHSPFIDQPEAVLSAIAEFVAGLTPAGGRLREEPKPEEPSP